MYTIGLLKTINILEVFMGYEWIELGVAGLVMLSALGTAVVVYFRSRKSASHNNKIEAPAHEQKLPREVPSPSKTTVQVERFVTLEEALKNTQSSFWGRLKGVFQSESKLNSTELEQIEEILYTSDLGPKTVQKLMSQIQDQLQGQEHVTSDILQSLLRNEMLSLFKDNSSELRALEGKPKKLEVWMIIGVNGAGKTTTIGKLCHKLVSQNLKVMVAAGDTFRAAAKEQLKTWADRSQVIFFSPEGVDNPSGVAFDAVKSALQQDVDILIVDTAGRLHTQVHLMEELKKVKRVMDKALPGCPHEVLLVLDANSGQNALIQAQEFNQALGVTGVILTKMDGTAKGGVALGVATDLNLDIKLIGVGEKVEDLRPFDAQEFVNSIL